ncbi:hypothetical protein H2203_005051 [Taxawa tesnikishii (nom. ined.)]|nr:hypothetical protein H2203_005051 [Dothideales sp. JES 119]
MSDKKHAPAESATNNFKAATVEDYNSDDGEAVADTRQTASKTANFAAKRSSQSSGLGKSHEEKETPPKTAPPDAASDSGYSSHTNATAANADPSHAARTQRGAPSNPTANEAAASPVKRRPTRQGEYRKNVTTPIATSAPAIIAPTGESNKGCQTSATATGNSVRLQLSSIPSRATLSPTLCPAIAGPAAAPCFPSIWPAFNALCRTTPSTETTGRVDGESKAAELPCWKYAAYVLDGWAVWCGLSRSTADKDALRAESACIPPLYQPLYQSQSGYPQMGMPPPNATFAPPSPAQPAPTSPLRDVPRLPVTQPATENYSARRQTVSMYGPPIITQDLPRAQGNASAAPSARRADVYRVPGAFESDGSSTSSGSESASESESEPEARSRFDRARDRREREDRKLMPPPQRRPSLKHSNTTSAVIPMRKSREPLRQRTSRDLPARTQSSRNSRDIAPAESPIDRLDLRERLDKLEVEKLERMERLEQQERRAWERERERLDALERLERRDRQESHSSHSSRARRPSLANTTSSGRTKATSYSNSSGSGKVVIESRTGRRLSYVGHEKRNELERQRNNAEAYMERARGGQMPEVTIEDTIRAAKALNLNERITDRDGYAERPALMPKPHNVRENASVISSGSKSSNRSHRSRHSVTLSTHDEARSTVTSRTDNGGGIKITTGGTTIEFSGDMDGKTISFRPQDDGHTEVVVGDGRRLARERRYRDGGSSVGRSRVGSQSRDRGRSRRESRARPVVIGEEYEAAI